MYVVELNVLKVKVPYSEAIQLLFPFLINIFHILVDYDEISIRDVAIYTAGKRLFLLNFRSPDRIPDIFIGFIVFSYCKVDRMVFK